MYMLQMRMFLLVSVLFSIIFAVVVMVGHAFGVSSFFAYFLWAGALMFVQYMIGPRLVEWSMRVRYINRGENPRLFQMVENLAHAAQIPVPKIGISQIDLPNAFAFGRSIRDGRVCVTEGLLRLLDEEELRAVLGHELTHLKNRDMLTITLLSVIPQ